MGCFNTKGCFSNMPIVYGDRAVVLLGIMNCQGSDEFAPGTIFTPISLPIRGTYDEYGSLENIDNSPTNKILEDLFGKPIEKIIELANSDERCETTDNAIKNILNEWFESIKEITGTQDVNKFIKYFSFVRIMEHEDVFDNIIDIANRRKETEEDYDEDNKMFQDYKTFIKEVETKFGLEKYNADKMAEILKNVSEEDRPLFLAYQFDTLVHYFKWKTKRNIVSFLPDYVCNITWHCHSIHGFNPHFGEIDRRFILFPYKNIELKDEYKKEFVDFACFMDDLSKLNLTWGDSCYYRQQVHYDECINFLETTLKLMKEKQKKYDEE